MWQTGSSLGTFTEIRGFIITDAHNYYISLWCFVLRVFCNRKLLILQWKAPQSLSLILCLVIYLSLGWNTYTVVLNFLSPLHFVCFVVFHKSLHEVFGSWSSRVLAASIRQGSFRGRGGDRWRRSNFLNLSCKPQKLKKLKKSILWVI